MKRLSLQWRMTLLTALLIAGACICLNLLLYRSGATGMDSLNGYIMQYQLGDAEGLAIEIPDAQMTDFIHHFSQLLFKDGQIRFTGIKHVLFSQGLILVGGYIPHPRKARHGISR